MPRYYRKRFYRRKRSYKNRYKRNRRFRSKYSKMTSMRSRNIVAPDTAFTKLKFTYMAAIAPVGPTPATLPSPSSTLGTNFTNRRLIRGNDIFDPQSTSGTAQATGFQQWCNQTGLYQEFVVHGSKCKIDLINNSPTRSMSACLYPIMESNATQTNIYGPQQPYVRNAFVGTSAGNNKVTLRNFMKTKKMLGIKDLTDQTLYNGTYNSSPTAQIIWDWALDCLYSDGNITDSQYTVDLKVEVTYYVQFLQRPVVSASVQP